MKIILKKNLSLCENQNLVESCCEKLNSSHSKTPFSLFLLFIYSDIISIILQIFIKNEYNDILFSIFRPYYLKSSNTAV